MHNVKCGLPAGRTNLAIQHEARYKPPHPLAGTDQETITDFDLVDQVGDEFWFIEDKLETMGGKASTVARGLRENLSKYEKAILAHFDGHVDMPPRVNLNGLSMYGDNAKIRFGGRIKHADALKPEFQEEVMRQVIEWEKRHNIKVSIEFITP